MRRVRGVGMERKVYANIGEHRFRRAHIAMHVYIFLTIHCNQRCRALAYIF